MGFGAANPKLFSNDAFVGSEWVKWSQQFKTVFKTNLGTSMVSDIKCAGTTLRYWLLLNPFSFARASCSNISNARNAGGNSETLQNTNYLCNNYR